MRNTDEKIEGKLGISLATIFNADEIWFRFAGSVHRATQKPTLLKPMFFFNREEIIVLDDRCCNIISVHSWEGYGKTWAFTKEELK